MIFKRPKVHRLFHSLVFSSVLCLEGCATTMPAAQDASSASAATSQTVESSSSSSSSSSSAYAEPRLSATPPDPLADARICERGWPTTKAGNGNSFQECKTMTLADGSERTECTDQEGRCALP